MKIIQLKRQGVSSTLKAFFNYDLRRKNTYLFIEIGSYQGKFIYGKVHHYLAANYIANMNDYIQGRDIEDVKEKIIKHIKIVYKKECQFSDFIEGYCFPFGLDRSGVSDWADRQENDYYLTHTVYCKYTDTIRHAMFNYCLVHFENGEVEKPLFGMDKATHPFDDLIKKVCDDSWIHDCDRKHGQLYCKGRLAWLIGEELKENRPEKSVKLRSIVNGVWQVMKHNNDINQF